MLFQERLNYEISGGGENALLLLHGWGGSSESWLPVVRDMAGAYKIINIDFPGFGKSPAPDADWGVSEYCELLRGLLESLGIERADVIAHSFGGRVALMLSAKYPRLVSKQVLTGCAGLRNPNSGSGFSQLSWLYNNRLARALLGEKGVQRLKNALRAHFGSADYRAASPVMREVLRKVVAQDLGEYLERIQAPTLLIWGENDTATPLWMGREMEKRIPDAGLVLFENAGHFAYLEQYARFIAVVKRFLIGGE